MTRYKEYDNKVKPAIPCILLSDSEGYQAFDSTGQFHTWNTSIIQTNHFAFTTATNKIFLKSNSSGLFKITYNCSYLLGQGGGDVITTCLYKNDSKITGTDVMDLLTVDELDATSQSSIWITFLSEGDSIQVYTSVGVGTVALSAANTSRILI